jgi:hypothetical protein
VWAALVVGWSLVRALVVGATLSDYGVNPWLYLVIDLASAIVDALSTPRAVIAFIDRQYGRALQWLAASAIVFVLPDLYLVLGGKRLPRLAFVVIGAVVVVTSTAAVVGIRRRVVTGRRATSAPHAVEAVEDAPER